MPPTVEDALLHWLHLFDAAKEVESLDELSDGRIIAAVFSELHPGSAIEAGLLSSSYNWMLKQNNIDKVLQELMGVYQKRCQVPPERMPLTSMVNSAAIAKEASRADLVLVLRVLATSILASPALDRIGGAIMEMNQNNRTEGCPDVIMGLMQETQEEFGIENPPGDQDLDVSGEQDDYFVDPHFGDGPELHAYDGAPTAADSQAQRSRMYGNAGGLRSAWRSNRAQGPELDRPTAALEERIAALEKEMHLLKQERDEAWQERDEARKLLSERDTWLADALDRQLQHAGEAERLKRQRDAAQGKLQEQKRLRAALESTVDAARDEARELERKLERECARAAESDSLLQDKLVTETQNADLQRRLTHAEQQLEPVLTQVQHARAASISDWLQERARWEQRLQREKADLERQLEEAQEAAQEHPAAPAAPSLADELQVEARHRGEMQALEERLAAANQSVERLQAKAIEQLTAELDEAKADAERQREAARGAAEQLELERAAVVGLKKRLGNAEAWMLEQSEVATATQRTLEQEVAVLRERLAAAEAAAAAPCAAARRYYQPYSEEIAASTPAQVDAIIALFLLQCAEIPGAGPESEFVAMYEHLKKGVDKRIAADKAKGRIYVGRVTEAAARMILYYTSGEGGCATYKGKARELCSWTGLAMVCEDNDRPRKRAMAVQRTLNKFLVTVPAEGAGGRFAGDVMADIWTRIEGNGWQLFRGGGMHPEHKDWFVPGKRYRQPRVVPTSLSLKVAESFVEQRGKADGCFPVLWVVKIDPARRCCHINYISAEDSFHAEDELPFAAGSVFDVEEVDWAPAASGRPSRIVIRAAPDNKEHPLDLPEAPWG
eukprot:TRINITY_DN1220_c0_g1_i5.p1 TRINITY_DN1220_c0_g1~~TRINITY_DN1220_c0_g1_i5.p1  ORF type:complete len:874 (+),score=296.56 TRINITY_DN1220_c0_g1_i5:94-2622(+)